MKKSRYIALVLSVFGILIFGIGMCLCLLPTWEHKNEGIIIGIFGIVIVLASTMIYRRMEHLACIKITPKTMGAILLAIAGVLMLGVGMCLTMINHAYLFGIVLGMLAILALFSLIPLCKGLQ